MSTTSSEKITQASFSIAQGVCMAITILMIIASCYRFLRTKNMRKPLIILFYTFAFVNSIVFLLQVVMREYARFTYDRVSDSDYYAFFSQTLFIVETLTLACTFSIDGITMLSLGLSIQQVQKRQTKEILRCIKRTAVVMSTIFILCCIFFSLRYQDHQLHHIVRMVVDLSILAINSCVLVFLMYQLN